MSWNWTLKFSRIFIFFCYWRLILSFWQAAASVDSGKRILFRFDKAAFSFKFLPFKVPYPVPFKLLGDEAKGWLDTTYLSPQGNIRISKGNKVLTYECREYRPFAFTSQELESTPLSYKNANTELGFDFPLQELFVQGTTFVLQKDVDPRQRLLRAIAINNNVEKVKLFSHQCLTWIHQLNITL